ncbi:RNA polymerase sigma factor [Virgisporangium aurantiacum]|uniref:RNA polymerase sigma factor n=1 Tax=Virgisporangium aurantiacum TaxID=175570 RepID=A0A8J4DZN1_9ACTN|nr:sigma-70 family RNA polymerase sigma factor [Virgisporangium aurantiacum]GIJ55753.1 RNA polymerase sigma factor [Virgisporangium aurantiacum]
MGGERESPHDVIAQLMAAAIDGDERAWNKLVERFSALLWSICRTYGLGPADAADAFQLTWLRLLEHMETIQEPARLAGWLATTCRRECMAILRRSRRVMLSSDDALFDRVSGQAPEADRATLLSDRDAELWLAFGRLSERCQRLLRVLVVEPEDGAPSYDMAAAVLDMPKGSLGPTRGRCLEQLRKYLDDGGISGGGP